MEPTDFLPGYSYYGHHVPTGEDWHLIGLDPAGNRVCAAGRPPTIGKLSDMTELEAIRPLRGDELFYRTKEFGANWL